MIKSFALTFIIWSSLLVIGCGAEESGQADFDSGRPGGGSGYTQVDESNKQNNQGLFGQSLRLPASVLNGPIGEPPLEGDVVLNFTTIVKTTVIGEDGRAVAGGSSAAFFEPQEGEFLVVYYTVTNETKGGLQSSTHINNAFKMIDDQGRIWASANYFTHGFEVPYAVGIESGIFDTRKFVNPGETKETGIAFDVPTGTNLVSLRSEILDLDVSLKQ